MGNSFFRTFFRAISGVAFVTGLLALLLFCVSSTALANTHIFPTTMLGSVSDPDSTFSHNWSGYVADNSSYSSVSGTWLVPEVSTDQSIAADATWVGIGGQSSADLIQAGTQAIIQNGETTYQAWYELLPDASTIVPLTIHAKDSITTSITEQSPDVWLVLIQNNSTGQTYRTTLSYHSSHTSVEWIEEMPSTSDGLLPLDSFGAVSFTGAFATQNGSYVPLSQIQAQPVTMTSNRETVATPSALGPDGASFTVLQNQVPQPVGVHIVRYIVIPVIQRTQTFSVGGDSFSITVNFVGRQ